MAARRRRQEGQNRGGQKRCPSPQRSWYAASQLPQETCAFSVQPLGEKSGLEYVGEHDACHNKSNKYRHVWRWQPI